MRFAAGILSLLFAVSTVSLPAEASVPQTPPSAAPQERGQGGRNNSKKAVNVPLDRFRSRKTIVRQGLMPLPDSLKRDSLRIDSLATDSLAADSLSLVLQKNDSLLLHEIDSIFHSRDSVSMQRLDSLLRDTTRSESIRRKILSLYSSDSILLQRLRPIVENLPQQDTLLWRFSGGDSLLRSLLAVDSLARDSLGADSLARKKKRGQWFMSDSMSLSRVCWMSLPLPGYGQIYNKQYWKLPILYGTVGTSLAMFLRENNKFKPLKKEFEALTDQGLSRSEELDALQTRMIRSNTRRQIYLFTAIGSYIYFIGDAAVNYSTNDVSSVKKATTLATICPAAGQIYNKSYWKVPIVIGGFASMIYVIDWNTRGYNRFKKAYRLAYDYEQKLAEYKEDPDNIPQPEPTDEFKGRYSAEYLKNLKNNYRRNRDLSIIITAGIYILQIVDAHVDAHLKDFDISDDLSMRLEPALDHTYIAGTGTRPVYGFNFTFNF
ncbi:DUF5683 domain-containing protein [uncultured Alistipes sp.]|uniref:DUF5683 domain-containing protein n=1 Tax=uncultured Alistipes sp. TaxID=538949 RepID=UPI0034200B05